MIDHMFIGRQMELQLSENLYSSDSFAFLVMYGRRCVGKTSLLIEYAAAHKTIFFSARKKNSPLNPSDFSRAVQASLTHDDFGTFRDWEAAFQYNEPLDSEKRALSKMVEQSFYPRTQAEQSEDEHTDDQSEISILLDRINQDPDLLKQLLQNLASGAISAKRSVCSTIV